MTNRSGFTLIELTFALLIGGIALLTAIPAGRHARDVLAVRAARDNLVEALALTRALAPLHGGAELVVEAQPAALAIRTAGRVHEALSLHDRFGVALRVEGSGQSFVTLRFDALGIGRVANRSIALTRGRARAGLSLSMYGRPRTW